MTKENLLFGIVGLLAGLIVGFMFANAVNKGSIATMANTSSQAGTLPTGHPDVPGGQPAGRPKAVHCRKYRRP